MKEPLAQTLEVCVALREAGVALRPDERMAWFPDNASGRERLMRERRVLFRAPRVLFESTRAWIGERLAPVLADRSVRDAAARVLNAYEEVAVAADDRVLVHGDLGLHNITTDAATDDLIGVFDYDRASWSDRHHDFRYLLFDDTNEDMLNAARRAYEPVVGRTLSRPRIRPYNAAGAVSFLAYRDDVAPAERHAGRTLAEDLAWFEVALGRLPGPRA